MQADDATKSGGVANRGHYLQGVMSSPGACCSY